MAIRFLLNGRTFESHLDRLITQYEKLRYAMADFYAEMKRYYRDTE